MKNISLLFCILSIVLGLSSCKKDNESTVEEIGYGTSFGMCVGYCFNEVAIVKMGEVTFSKSANGVNPSTKTCTKTITESELFALKKLVNINSFKKLPEVIGCPDGADGGAEWISLSMQGKVKKVMFEYGNVPNDLKKLVAKLRAIEEDFKDCN